MDQVVRKADRSAFVGRILRKQRSIDSIRLGVVSLVRERTREFQPRLAVRWLPLKDFSKHPLRFAFGACRQIRTAKLQLQRSVVRMLSQAFLEYLDRLRIVALQRSSLRLRQNISRRLLTFG